MNPKLSPVHPTFAWLRWAKLLSFIFCLLSFIFSSSALSQVPQGFNYQAVARDAVSGNPITDPIDVKIAILSNDAPEMVIWEELHEDVDPDDHGLFSIVVSQGDYESGPVTDFSDIDWTVTPKYIRTQIDDGGGWKNMGSARIWSVPYAMVADSLGGPLKKLSVQGETDDLEEALFEVRNKAGHTVFAVYNEGVRVYVSDGDVKGPKGGFAIGSLGYNKLGDQDFFFVSGDSIRAYIDSTSVKGVKGGFAIGGFDKTKAKGQEYLRVTRDSVRVYLDANPATKGPKGGFAIGGFDLNKGIMQTYLDVTPDSTRIYVNDHSSDAGVNGFAVKGRNTSTNKEGDYMTLGRYNSKLYSLTASAAGDIQEFTSWNLIVEEGAKAADTIKLMQAAYAILSMTIPYGGDGAKGIPARFEVNTVMTTKGVAAKVISVGLWNVLFGSASGSEVNGQDNIIIGNGDEGVRPVYGTGNIVLGKYENHVWDQYTPGNNNVLLGTGTSFNGSSNVCIGYMAGSARVSGDESDKLFIENSSADKNSALIYGEFDNDLLSLNARVTVRDALKLKPRTSAPAGATEGEMYYDSGAHKLFVYDGTTWQGCW